MSATPIPETTAKTMRGTVVFRAGALIFIVLLIGNSVAGRWVQTAEPADSSVESTRIAASLVRDRSFSNPYGLIRTGPSAHVAPAYPVLYATLLSVLGPGKATWWAIRVLTIAAYALQLALLLTLAGRLNLHLRVGAIACILGCLIPLPGSLYKWEAVFAGLLLVILATLTACLRTRRWGLALAAGLGLTWGISLLVSPSLLPVWVVWLPLVCIYAQRRIRIPATLAVAVLPFVIISPWLIRDYRVFHAFMLIRDNFGTELAASNNDCASSWAMETVQSGCADLVHPSRSLALEQRIAEIGEYKFNVERSLAGRAWIREHPARFLKLCALRFVRFWFPVFATHHGFGLIAVIEISLMTVFMIAGLAMLVRRDLFGAYLLGSAAAAYSFVYYLLALDLRFGYPILWISLFGSAYWLNEVWTRRAVRAAERAIR